MTFWISFYVPEQSGEAWTGQWWVTGETCEEPPRLTVCGVIEADDETSAVAAGRAALGDDAQLRFAVQKPDGWAPQSDRFAS